MKITNPEKRLDQFWGKVDQKHIRLIAEWVTGSLALDVGSGFGTTSAAIAKQKAIKCIGIECDPYSLQVARRLHPTGAFLFANCERLGFPANSFDVIILRDVLHHLKGESTFQSWAHELIRVSKPNARIIILDPNVTLLLRAARKIASHKDEECSYGDALRILKAMGCTIAHTSFNTLFSLPLSGGYVGVPVVPPVAFLQRLVLSAERAAEAMVNSMGLGRYLCWRYLIVAHVLKAT